MIDFSKSYNQKNFCEFLGKFLPDDYKFVYNELKIESGFNYFVNAKLLANVDSLNNLKIIEIEHSVSEKKRITISRDLFRFLSSFAYPNALVITHSKQEQNYRFSFISSSLDWVTEKKVKRTFSNPKRLSFFLGPDSKIHTPTKQLIKLGKIKNFSDLNDRFNIEVVSNEFFTDYKMLFKYLIKYLNEDKIFSSFAKKASLDIDFFARKLLGQIVFCYFLQKKGWLGVTNSKSFGNGDYSFIRNQFIKYDKNKQNFFNDFLEYFFYEGLNKKNENNYLKKIQCKVPYIGGNLFEYYEGYDWKKEVLNIPNKTFSNKDKTGILDIFDLYNFTVDENESLDIEIAIDPEMLGRVFENLLPENIKHEEAPFYTPRPVVNYMCEESLINFLSNKLKNTINQKDINDLVKDTRFDISKKTIFQSNANLIDRLLSEVKICDPAIGSGAFVVVMMNIIVRLRLMLSSYIDRKYKNNSYYFKRDCIKNSIYGVDINLSAVEITKLRLWLSLIVDEIDYEKTEPLPNLDFKVIQGNSLIETYEGINFGSKIFNSENKTLDAFATESETKNDIEKLAKLQSDFFKSVSYSKKQSLKVEIENLMIQIFSQIINNNKHIKLKSEIDKDTIKKLISIRFKRSFFPWGIFFAEVFFINNGFDIVIANPPYISVKKVNQFDWKDVLKNNFGFLDDLYNHFTFLASYIVKDDGIISFVTSDTFMTLQTKTNMRKLLFKYKLISFLTLPKAFKALVDTCIFIVQKKKLEKNNKINFIDLRNVEIDALNNVKKDSNIFTWEKILKKTFDTTIYTKNKFIDSSLYLTSFNFAIFTPTKKNLLINDKIVSKINRDYNNYWQIIKTSSAMEKSKSIIKDYNNKLKDNSVTLLGLITLGGQGLATGNNGEFIGVLNRTKEAERIKNQRIEKFYALLVNNKKFLNKFSELSKLNAFEKFEKCFNKFKEEKIRNYFILAKKEFGRDIFGQGFLYKIIHDDEVAEANKLSKTDKESGVKNGKRIYVKYDKGDKDGNKWYFQTPYYIKWNQSTVKWFVENSGHPGVGMPVIRNKIFYFKKAFCWSNILNPNSKYIKCRMNNESVYDVASMSLTSINDKVSNEYLICLLNSNYAFEFLRNFLNSTVNIQINDIRKIPVVIPSKKINDEFKELYFEAKKIKIEFYQKKISPIIEEEKNKIIQNKIDLKFNKIYEQI